MSAPEAVTIKVPRVFTERFNDCCVMQLGVENPDKYGGITFLGKLHHRRKIIPIPELRYET